MNTGCVQPFGLTPVGKHQRNLKYSLRVLQMLGLCSANRAEINLWESHATPYLEYIKYYRIYTRLKPPPEIVSVQDIRCVSLTLL